MKSKFTITTKDKKYMDSIAKSLHNPSFRRPGSAKVPTTNPWAESYRAKNAKVHAEYAKSKALKGKIGTGKSHYSGKEYKYE